MYAGEQYDSVAGQYYLRTRHYNPDTGRFTASDIYAGTPDNPLSQNRYTYCENNPITYADPLGLWAYLGTNGGVDRYEAEANNNDTLWSLAQKVFNDGNKYSLFGRTSSLIHPGDIINVTSGMKADAGLLKDTNTTCSQGKASGSSSQVSSSPVKVDKLTTYKDDPEKYVEAFIESLIEIGHDPRNIPDGTTDKVIKQMKTHGVIADADGGTIFRWLVDIRLGTMNLSLKDIYAMSMATGIEGMGQNAMLMVIGQIASNTGVNGTSLLDRIKSKLKGKGEPEPNPVGGGCFTAGTLVSTEDGQRPIEEVKVGDYVWSENLETGEKGLKKVLKTFIHDKYTLIHVYTGDTMIETTEEHPFWVEEKGWVFAGELNEGDVLRLKSGENVKVTKLERVNLKEPVKVYNLEVEDWHTYYVSDINVLVHNKAANVGYKKPISGSGKEKATDVPSWAKGNKPYTTENGKDFATRLMDDKYGKGNWSTSSKEYSQIKKWGDRGFE